MKLCLLLFLIATHVWGDEVYPIQNIISLMRKTPASGSGRLSMGESRVLHEETIKKKLFGIAGYNVNLNTFVKISLKAYRPIDFGFGEDYITVKPAEAIDLRVNGIKIVIEDIVYQVDSRGIGKFSVKTKTPLGILKGTAKKQIEAALQSIYAPRLKVAFQELKRIRTAQTTDSAQASMNAIISVLSGPPSPNDRPLPTITGNVDLTFNPGKEKVRLAEELWAKTKAGDNITMGVNLRIKNGNTAITGLYMSSDEGIRVQGRTNLPELFSVNVKNVRLNASGFHMDYAIGAEEAVAGFIVLFGAIKTQMGGRANCPESVQINFIRKSLDRQVKEQLGVIIRAQRPALLEAGISPRILNAFTR
jgi:hypothetical protein